MSEYEGHAGGRRGNFKCVGNILLKDYVRGSNSRRFLHNLDPVWLMNEFIKERIRTGVKVEEVSIEFDLDGHSYRMRQHRRGSHSVWVERLDEIN